MSHPYDLNYAIAIIGTSGRFPGASNLAEFWENLHAGTESITFFSDQELKDLGLPDTMLKDPYYVKAEAGLEGADMFDASFFGFTPREAEIMDPQHRLFIEESWNAIETAGYNTQNYAGRIGVFAGIGMNSYFLNNLQANRELLDVVGNFQTVIGNNADFLATHTSYKLDLKGPSVTVQTACSTSLVAVHMACQSLLSHECDMALAGGVAVKVNPYPGYFYQEGGVMSPDGHCRAFDAKSQGTIRGSGVGVVVLKRLSEALLDGDSIQALIRGSAINNDGAQKVGFTAPSVAGQASVIREALELAMVEPDTISYVESHGTGTALGDPVEIAALTEAFRASTDRRSFCAIGSVKTNIGHLDAAAGIASLVKTTLAFKNKQLPPSLHFQDPNPKIDFANSPFYVNSMLSDWKNGTTPRRAGVSSFGIGGTNAHVILEEAPAVDPSGPSRPYQLFLLSAKTDSAVESATTSLRRYLQENPTVEPADVAYTLQVGRRAFDRKRAFIGRTVNDLLEALDDPNQAQVLTNGSLSDRGSVAMMFPGQGAQYVGMASELYQNERDFRQQVDYCCEVLRPSLGLDLRQVLYPREGETEVTKQRLRQTSLAQPALFVIEYALARLWMSWGVRPDALIGHSIGEYVAACLADVFSVEDALGLVAIRGRLMQQIPAGSMIAVPISEHEARVLTQKYDRLDIAAVNAPRLTVLSGPHDSIADLELELTREGVGVRRLHTSHAFHSAMMLPILDEFTRQVAKIKLKAPSIPYISNLTGRWIKAEEATNPEYWSNHLRQTVLFGRGVAELLVTPHRILLEVGPGQTLSKLARQVERVAGDQVMVSSLPDQVGRVNDYACLLEALGRLWLAGVEPDWMAFSANERRHRLPLPTYPFERQRYWVEQPKHQISLPPTDDTLGRKSDIAEWYYIPSWKRSHLLDCSALGEMMEGRKWLIFTADGGIGDKIIDQLEQHGALITTVRLGGRFTKSANEQYTVNPDRPEDYQLLVEELLAGNAIPDRILHLWGVTIAQTLSDNPDDFEDCQYRGFYSLIFLARALADQMITVPISIGLITNGVQSVTGEEPLNPAKATVIGVAKVLRQEYPHFTCRTIDVIQPDIDIQALEHLARQIVTDVAVDDGNETIAYRGKHRWVQAFEPLRLPVDPGHIGGVRPGGVYLLTGGLSDLDFALAEYLMDTAQAKIILTGQSTFPARNEWEQYLVEPVSDEKLCQKIRKSLDLEKRGAGLLIAQADVTDEEQMREVMRVARERFGRIDGIFHSATVTGGGLIQLKTPKLVKPMLAPKVQGTLVILSLWREMPFDFLVLFSSSLAITGAFGEADYCAANAFLDAVAQASDPGPAVLTINWALPEWEQHWEQSLSAAALGLLTHLRQIQHKYGITNREAAEALCSLLSKQLRQVVVSTRDFPRLLEQLRSASAADILQTIENASRSSNAPNRADLNHPYEPPNNDIEETIAEIWKNLFGLTEIGRHDNYIELGGNSLLAIQLVSQLRKAFQVDLPLSSLFESPTVSGLAAAIADSQLKRNESEEVEAMLREIEGLSLGDLQTGLAQELFESDGHR